MKRFLSLTLLFLVTFTSLAQTQQGYVKTRGRLDANGQLIPGVRLLGATISVKNGGSYVSGNNGTFSLNVPSGTFYLTNVQKNGYQLCDRDILGRIQKYSSNPLVVVMDTPDQILEDRLESEGKIRATLTAQLNKQKTELRQLKEQQKISQQEYNKLLQELYTAQNNNEKLISEMAERYSSFDLEEMDEFRRKVAFFILNGELTRADSLLNTQGTMEEQEAELDRLHAANTSVRENLRQSEKMEEVKLENFAANCYSRYEICKLQHKNDSAAYWLELRASKDTTNLKWQTDAGAFIFEYICSYQRALQYYEKTLARLMEDKSIDKESLATCYSNIGAIYNVLQDYTKALIYTEKSLALCKEVYGDSNLEIAFCYNNLGAIYKNQDDYVHAYDYYSKALNLQLSELGEKHPDVAHTYSLIGSIYYTQGNYDKSIETHRKVLEIQIATLGESHPQVARSYFNIGFVYAFLGHYEKARGYYEKSLTIYKEVFSEPHINIAMVYDNIGLTYFHLGEYDKALSYYTKSLNMYKEIFGENNSHVASVYGHIGGFYNAIGDHKEALNYEKRFLDICLVIYGNDDHLDVAMAYFCLGCEYGDLGEYNNAYANLNKSLEIRMNLLGKRHSDVATVFRKIGYLYTEQHNYLMAIENYNNALLIEKEIFGENHPNIAISYHQIGYIYGEIKEYKKAIEYLERAVSILRNIYKVGHPDIDDYYSDLCFMYNAAKFSGILLEEYDEVMSHTVHVAITVDGDTPAKKQGLNGEYIFLEYEDWNIESNTNLGDTNERLRGKPKSILLFKDGTITQHYFENSIGTKIVFKYIDKEEKQRIIEAYHNWRKEH